MQQITIQIDGMACSMCEAHISDVIRNTFPAAKKVSASHRKGEASFLLEEVPELETLREAINATGYRYLSGTCAPYEKKGLFRR